MKRDELKALGLSDDQIDKVMEIHGADITSLRSDVATRDEKIKALTTERDGLNTQLKDRDKDIAELRKKAGDNEDLNQKLSDLQAKYDKDTADLTATLAKQARDHATDTLFGGVKFTSALAKKAAIAEFNAANHELKDGRYVDADNILKKMRDENPDAFASDEEKKDDDPGAGGGRKPKFTDPLDDKGKGGGGDKNPFTMNFTPVRKSGTSK